MQARDLIRRRFAQSAEVKRALGADEYVAFTAALADLLVGTLEEGGKVLLCGNGGSAGDATHLAAELVGRFYVDRPALPAISLCDNVAAVTSIANDYEFDEVFARQVRAHGRARDVLLAFSTSGGSANVLAAVDAAHHLGMAVAGFTGVGGGALAERCDLVLRVPSEDTPRIQEAHMLVGHTVCELVEARMFVAHDSSAARVRR
jgi:D-sedoheptulose 7-phosphate isomerase